jgi:hypothetical protein
MNPLFQIGEEVILWSEAYPIVNGVSATIADCEYYELWDDGSPSGYGYVFYEQIPGGRDDTDVVNERHLRKKPKGCGKSFDQVINELKRPVKV